MSPLFHLHLWGKLTPCYRPATWPEMVPGVRNPLGMAPRSGFRRGNHLTVQAEAGWWSASAPPPGLSATATLFWESPRSGRITWAGSGAVMHQDPAGRGLTQFHITGWEPTAAVLGLDPAAGGEPDPDFCDWGALRSAVARRDWITAWRLAGVGSYGPDAEPSPAEDYILREAQSGLVTGTALHEAWSQAFGGGRFSSAWGRATSGSAAFYRIKRLADAEEKSRSEDRAPLVTSA